MFEALSRYADFNGRGSRSEFWLFILLSCIVMPLAVGFDFFLFPNGSVDEYGQPMPAFILTGISYLGLIIPSIAAHVRRLHDTDRSGWWCLISFVPLVGAIVLLIFCVQAGDPRRNRFGPAPKETPGRVDDSRRGSFDDRYSDHPGSHSARPRVDPSDRFGNHANVSPFSNPVASPPVKKASQDGWLDQLEQLARLRDQGVLTEEEFSAEKAVLLAEKN